MSIIISIKPKYSKLIFEGTKTIELRKSFAKEAKEGDICYVYSSMPEKMLLGYFEVKSIEKLKRRNIYVLGDDILNSACVSVPELLNYFQNWKPNNIVLIHIKRFHAFEAPIPLKELQESIGFRPPMSWQYASEEMVNFLKDRV